MIGCGEANANNALKIFNTYAVDSITAGSRTTFAAFFAFINNSTELKITKYKGIYVQALFTPAHVRSWVRLTEHARRRILINPGNSM